MQKHNNALLPYSIGAIDNESSDESAFIITSYCSKDDVQLFIKITRSFESAESEEIRCPFCFGACSKDDSEVHYVKSSSTPEIVGCLVLKNKTLHLVHSRSSSEQEMDAIKAIIDQHDFTKYAEKIKSFLSRKNFHLNLKPQNLKNFLSLKNLRKPRIEKLKKLKKIDKRELQKQNARVDRILRENKSASLIRKHSLESIREQWTSLQKNTVQLLKPSENVKTRKKLSRTRSLLNATKRSCLVGLKQLNEELEYFQFNIASLPLKVDHYPELKKVIRRLTG